MNLKIDAQLKTRFSDLTVLTCNVKDVKVEKQNVELEKFKDEITEKVREKYELDSVKNLPTFRAYRDFFWRVGIDPTKNRPAAEALIRRILGGRTIPRINTLVDAYNLASVKTEIALAAFDANKLKGRPSHAVCGRGREISGNRYGKTYASSRRRNSCL